MNKHCYLILDEAVAKYQDPTNADQIMRIQKNLDETRDVLHQTIDSVLQVDCHLSRSVPII